MALSDEVLEFQETFRQARILLEVKSGIGNCYSAANELYKIVQKYQGSDFDGIPVEIRTAFTRMYQLCNQMRQDIEADPAFSYIVSG